MNIHPLVVHFPIAFLTLYALVEIFSVFYRKHTESIFAIKSFMLITGWLSSIIAAQTGEIAREINGGPHDILEMHERFANTTIWIFGVLAIIYIAYLLFVKNVWGAKNWLDRYIMKYPGIAKILRWKVRTVQKLMEQRWLITLAAGVGLITIGTTGALGGAMVHGTQADPIIALVIRILGL